MPLSLTLLFDGGERRRRKSFHSSHPSPPPRADKSSGRKQGFRSSLTTSPENSNPHVWTITVASPLSNGENSRSPTQKTQFRRAQFSLPGDEMEEKLPSTATSTFGNNTRSAVDDNLTPAEPLGFVPHPSLQADNLRFVGFIDGQGRGIFIVPRPQIH
ncbi:unnamed protein product [Linum trigynum]|uniref:Uncharacterized protein n=1 Tax=Linum trigynum TaxID=586398 RepID=A0AAV2EAI6_9ROSI